MITVLEDAKPQNIEDKDDLKTKLSNKLAEKTGLAANSKLIEGLIGTFHYANKNTLARIQVRNAKPNIFRCLAGINFLLIP